jgi:hypothetical protein
MEAANPILVGGSMIATTFGFILWRLSRVYKTRSR